MTPLVFDQVSKHYPGHRALSEVSFQVQAGELISLLGPNGAGKSTSIKIIMGLESCSQGQVRLFDQSPQKNQARKLLGCTPQDIDFPKTLRPREILNFVGAHYEQALPVNSVIERFGMAGFSERQCFGLSGGEKRRLALACALIGQPKLILLDEPTTGLDVETRKLFWNEIKSYVNNGGSVLLTTHYLEEAEALSNRIILMNRGQVLAQGPVAQIKSRFGRRRLSFSGTLPTGLSPDDSVEIFHEHISIESNDSDHVVRCLIQSGQPFKDLVIDDIGLEEALTRMSRSGTL